MTVFLALPVPTLSASLIRNAPLSKHHRSRNSLVSSFEASSKIVIERSLMQPERFRDIRHCLVRVRRLWTRSVKLHFGIIESPLEPETIDPLPELPEASFCPQWITRI